MVKPYKPDYRPAELVEGTTRWYIKVYNPSRLRKTFDLNRIHNLELRRQRGLVLVSLINWWLQAGLPLSQFRERTAARKKEEASQIRIAPRGSTSLQKALHHAVQIKEGKTRAESAKSYLSNSNIFLSFCELKNLASMPVDELEHYHIMSFIDHRQLIDKVSGTTINNNINHLSSLFVELEKRGFILNNPFDKIDKVRSEPKKRRSFNPDEAKVAIEYIYNKDKMLFLAILLQYSCFMRPSEIRKLKFRDIDLKTGVITILPETGKTGRKVGTRYATIPEEFDKYFKILPNGLSGQYIFGPEFKPSAEKCSKGRMYKKHKRYLQELYKNGQLKNIEGLTFYSWKDTGITEALSYIDVISVRDQAGHSDTKMTLKYYQKPKINSRLRKMKNTIASRLSE